MLRTEENIYCSVFDSSIVRRYKRVTSRRKVEYYEIELFHECTGVSHINNRAYPVRRGMLLCAKPGETRYSELPVKCSFIRIVPVGSDIEKIIANFPSVVYIEDERKIETLFGLMEKLSSHFITKGQDATAQMRMNVLFLEIIYRCMRIYEGVADPSDMPANRRVREAYEYINENFAKDCSLKKIAASVHLTPNYLHTIFTRQIGMTPLAYVTRKRIERAKLQIMSGDKSMQEIALSLGFCSQSHFNRVFKSYCGITPAQYRESLLDRYTLFAADSEK